MFRLCSTSTIRRSISRPTRINAGSKGPRKSVASRVRNPRDDGLTIHLKPPSRAGSHGQTASNPPLESPIPS
eukprot:g57217.t1